MPLCFVVIYFVPGFYLGIGTAVAKELRIISK